jgi:type I restriction-modification system DNA methylase subunit
MARPEPAAKTNSSANIGFEAKLWLAADKLRSNMDAAEYKHVVLGLIFLKYISDSFEEHHAKGFEGRHEGTAATGRGREQVEGAAGTQPLTLNHFLESRPPYVAK